MARLEAHSSSGANFTLESGGLGFHASQAQRLQQGEVLVPARIPFDRADDGEAELAIKGRTLKIVGYHYHLLTPARHRLLLDGAHEPSAVALSAHVSRDEEIADIAGAAPGPAIGSADDPGVRPRRKTPNSAPSPMPVACTPKS